MFFSIRDPTDFSELYGVRDGRLLGFARRAHADGVWDVYLAAGTNETLFARGQFRRLQAASISEVSRIFSREGLELNFYRPKNIDLPDESILDESWGNLPTSALDTPRAARLLGRIMFLAASGKFPPVPNPRMKAPGRLMRAAADRCPEAPRDHSPTLQSNRPATERTGVRMNKKQKTILIAVIAAVVTMLMYPPFHAKLPNGAVRSLGYHLIFDPPALDYPFNYLTGTVDIGLLITQWLGVLIVGAIAFFLFKD